MRFFKAGISSGTGSQPLVSAFLTASSALATVWRARTFNEACSASSAIDLKYQQALALTTQRAGTSGRDAHSFLSSITESRYRAG
jgi:hypothetical protein